MFRRVLSCSCLLFLAGAVMFVMPSLGQAQHGGGGHGGSAHFGGGHSGGAHFSGGHFRGEHFGGHQGGYYYGHHHYYPRYGYGFYGFYPYYGYGPYYNDYYPYDYDTGPYYGSAYDSGYTGSSVTADPYPYAAPLSPAYPYSYSFTPSAATPTTGPVQSNTARLTVTVPPDAQVWFGESETSSKGPVREYQSPPLTPGSRYTYEIRARWNDNGHETRQTQKVEVTAGGHVRVNFPVAAKTAGSGVGR
jgi:uncharacterized protein (TIGR03000 family)